MVFVKRWWTLAALALVVGVASLLPSCAPSDFDSQALVESVRILASAADKPYAKPGDTVNVQVLAFDGRPTQPEPMQIFWLPFLCKNPPNDAYFACFSQFGGGGRDGGSPAGGDAGAPGPVAGAAAGAGAGGGAGIEASLPPNVDLTPYLKSGPSFQFQMPADAVTSHKQQAGVDTPYGLIILFNFACAGHIEFVPLAPGNANPQAVPIGCFDKAHNQLGANDFVIGFTRIYAYDTLTNANPVIAQVDLPGGPVTPTSGVTSAFQPARCAADTIDNCPQIPIGPIVPPGDPNEQVTVAFFSTLGKFKYDVRLLYDVNTGMVGGPADTDTQFLAPIDLPAGPGPSGFIWMVVRDNRGGASWVTVPVHVP